MEIPKITTFLMFNNQAEEAINLYTSLFENSEILTMVKYGEEGPGVPGTVQHSYIYVEWTSIYGNRC